MTDQLDLDQLDFAKGGGLVTVVTQDARTGAVLMVAHADREALARTIETGSMHYRSRSRGLWKKGETSGNTQQVVRLLADCDGDAVLALVEPAGPACHTGAVSCFGDEAIDLDPLDRLDQVIAERAVARDSSTSYTTRLLGDRNLRLKKLGEEASELVLACADGDGTRAIEEAADLFYHARVALAPLGGSSRDVRDALAERSR